MTSVPLHSPIGLRAEAYGEGVTVLVPTLPSEIQQAADLRQAFIAGLTDRYRLVLVDTPSTPDPETFTADILTADLLAVADAVAAPRFVWFGYSWTGMIGIQLALRTDRLAGLICGGWPPLNGPYAEMLGLAETAMARRTLGPEIADAFEPVSSEKVAALYAPFATLYRGLQEFDDHQAQAAITCPRLCFVGADDTYAGTDLARPVIDQQTELERLGWAVQVVAGRDHLGVLDPAVVVPLVREWLDHAIDRAS
jgi:pimeloyl-ACP methyl ester carboxylesterase